MPSYKYEQKNIGKDLAGNAKWKAKHSDEKSAWDAIYGKTAAGGGGTGKNDTTSYFGAGSDNPNAGEPTDFQVSQRTSKPNINEQVKKYPGAITEEEKIKNKKQNASRKTYSNHEFSSSIRSALENY